MAYYVRAKKKQWMQSKKERKPERYIHFIYIVLNSYQGANRFCLFILLIVFTIFFHWKGAEVADPATRTLPAARGLAGVAVLDTGSVAHHPVYIHALFSRRRETPGAVANAGAAGDMVATATANFAARFVTMKENTQVYGLWCLMSLSTIFQLYRDVLFLLVEEIGVPKENHRPVESHWHIMLYRVQLVVIGTD